VELKNKIDILNVKCLDGSLTHFGASIFNDLGRDRFTNGDTKDDLFMNLHNRTP